MVCVTCWANVRNSSGGLVKRGIERFIKTNGVHRDPKGERCLLTKSSSGQSSQLDVFNEDRAPVFCLQKPIVGFFRVARVVHEIFLIFGDRQACSGGGVFQITGPRPKNPRSCVL